MTLKTKYIIVGILLLIVLVVVFFLGRNSKSAADPIKLPDTKQFEKSIDSVVILNKLHQDTVRVLKIERDSLKAIKLINNKQYINAIKEVKNFTPVSRNKWRDSISKLYRLR